MTPTDVRAHLATNNYVPIPCNGKAPVLKEWQKRTETSAGDIDIWATTYPNARNTGVLTARTPALDIDILDERAVGTAVNLVHERFGGRGRIMERRGLSPKLAILFRADVPFKKICVALTASDGSVGKIEFLCADQQLITDGIHPTTGAPYEWSGGDPCHVKRDELPPITEGEARALVADIAALMVGHGYQVADERKPNGNGHDGDGVDWGRLHENIRTGRDYHDTLRDLACKMVAAGTDPGAVVNILRACMLQSEAPHDARWQSRYDDIQRLVDTAEDLVRKGRADGGQPKDVDAEIARLAKLSLLEFEQQRKRVAEEMDIRAAVLDRLVDAKRTDLGLGDDTEKQGKPITFPEIRPWPEPVNGAALLDEIAATFARYIVMSEAARTVSAVWPIHTHVFSHFVVTPRLCVRSAVRNSGKTSYFGVLSHLLAKVLMAASATPASVFRTIGAHRPTLLIDEAAGMFDEAGELRRILNAGYRYDGAVLRSVGDSFEPRLFDVFSPVGFALTGMLPPDLHSRCICIDLQRKLASEKVEPYRIGQMQHLDALAQKIVRWVNDNTAAITNANPAMPPSVINRSSDLWFVMLSIAAVAGGDWPRRIEQAIAASLELGDDDSTLFEQLLADIHSVFGEKKEAVTSAELVEALVGMEGRPWPELGRSRKPLTQARLAKMLRGPGFCVTPDRIRVPRGGTEVQLRGYTKAQFEDLFARYLSLYTPPECHSVTNGDGTGTSGSSQGVTGNVTGDTQGVTGSPCDTSRVSCDGPCDTPESATNAGGTSVCDTVTLPRGTERPLLGMLEPVRVRQLVDWYRKQAKALRAEMSPGSLPAYLRQKLRETLAEELVAELVDDTADKIAKAATPKKRKSR
jgi:putative DNA primase/helicase